MTYLPNATIFQGTSPWVIAGSVTTYGTSAAAVTTVFQGGAPWTVNASIAGQIPVSATLATISVGNFPTTQTVAGSVTVYGSGLGGGTTTVFQGGAPWLTNASIVGQQNVTASIAGVPGVIATIANSTLAVTESGAWGVTATIGNTINAIATVTQGTNPWVISGSVTTYSSTANVTVTSVTLAALATVSQGTNPWLVNASIVGQQAVTMTVGTIQVGSQFATVYQAGAPWLVNASVTGILNVNATVPGIAGVNATYAAPWLVTSTNAGGYVANSADANVTGTAVFFNSALSATVATVKVGSTNLYGYHIYNPNAAVAYVSLFAATLVTLGKSVATSQLVIPPGGWADASSSGPPVTYSPALIVGATASTNGTGAPTTGIIANFWYK